MYGGFYFKTLRKGPPNSTARNPSVMYNAPSSRRASYCNYSTIDTNVDKHQQTPSHKEMEGNQKKFKPVRSKSETRKKEKVVESKNELQVVVTDYS